MARLIVPDNSVMIPAFFPESLDRGGTPFDITARARPLAHAVRLRRVRAFAPGLLMEEFLKIAALKAAPRSGAASVEAADAEAHILDFATLPITYVPVQELLGVALDLVMREKIAAPDSWYVACAIVLGAELWISHEHEDGLVEKARRVHADVHVLTDERFG
jgi:predicted nucleic acid-binding protein